LDFLNFFGPWGDMYPPPPPSVRHWYVQYNTKNITKNLDQKVPVGALWRNLKAHFRREFKNTKKYGNRVNLNFQFYEAMLFLNDVRWESPT
jgi:hypothetical protein